MLRSVHLCFGQKDMIMGPYKIITAIAFICLATRFTLAFKADLNRTINFSSNEGSIAVYDKAMPEWLTLVLKSFFKTGDRWTYEFPDSLAGITPRENNNMNWISPISPMFFMKSRPWIIFRMLAKDFTGRDDMLAYQVTATMLRRGESPNVVPGADSNEVYFRIFLSPEPQELNEMIFLDKRNEIVQAVKPKFNRIIAWNASFAYQYKPPDFDNFNMDYSIIVKMSPNAEKVEEEMKYIQKFREEEKKNSLDPFPFANMSFDSYSRDYYDAHCKRKFYDYRGGVIAVFDDIFDQNELAILRKYMVKHNSGYTSSDFDEDETNDADNVSWIVGLEPEVISGTKVLDVVRRLGSYLSGEDDWHQYDVALNMIQNTFHTRIHEDCEPYEFEYTFLLYLNPNWTENMYGETIFLNQVKDLEMDEATGTVIQDKEYETIVSVRPKYGRIAMFRNNIPHSARPPSPDFKGTRYTFAVKVARNKRIAMSKVLRELLEFKREDKAEGAALYEIMQNMAITQKFTLPVEDLRGNITKYRSEKNGIRKASAERKINKILRKVYAGEGQPSL